MNKSELVSVRGLLRDDTNFILATFLRGLYYGDSYFSEIPKSIFMKEYHKVADHLLNAYGSYIRIACLKDDPNVVLGYSILNADSTILHFTFVKKAWRNIGLAKLLVPNTVTTVTHLTRPGLSIAKRQNWDFNPFAI